MQSPFASSAASTSDPDAGDTILRGLVRGLLPCASVVLVLAVVLVLELLVGRATAGQDFFTQQRASVIVLIAGMLAAVATYIVMCTAAIRQLARWQSDGAFAAARGAVIGLVATGLVTLIPLLLAVFLPQHPAP